MTYASISEAYGKNFNGKKKKKVKKYQHAITMLKDILTMELRKNN